MGMKKAVTTDPAEKPSALWAPDAPNGAGVMCNGFRLAGFLRSNANSISLDLAVVKYP